MSKHYRDFIWKNGLPYGVEPVKDLIGYTYKIPADPYRKRIAVEEWSSGQFIRTIYDSALLDFRHLQPAEQTAWQKVIVEESADCIMSEIRNQDDRTILIETYQFEQGFCRFCQTHSPHGILICRQRLFYEALGDKNNGVLMLDSSKRPVMFKKYACENFTGEFSELIKEEWDMSQPLPLEFGVSDA